MKNLAKLAIFFSISFVIIFILSAGIRYLSLQVDWARYLPQRNETLNSLIVRAAHWALSFSMYSAVLITLSYAVRKKIFTPITISGVIVLSLFFNFGLSFLLQNIKTTQTDTQPVKSNSMQIGGKGLILSNTINRNETAVVLLNGMAEPLGPRVIAIPDRPLTFQESTINTGINLPPVPFENKISWFIESLIIDIRLSAENIQKQFHSGLFPYLMYSGALLLLLTSLCFIFKLSAWPLANLFLGIIAFRGILAIEVFFNSPEIQELFNDFFKGLIPVTIVVPLIFTSFGLLVHSYSFLIFMAKRRSNDDY